MPGEPRSPNISIPTNSRQVPLIHTCSARFCGSIQIDSHTVKACRRSHSHGFILLALCLLAPDPHGPIVSYGGAHDATAAVAVAVATNAPRWSAGQRLPIPDPRRRQRWHRQRARVPRDVAAGARHALGALTGRHPRTDAARFPPRGHPRPPHHRRQRWGRDRIGARLCGRAMGASVLHPGRRRAAGRGCRRQRGRVKRQPRPRRRRARRRAWRRGAVRAPRDGDGRADDGLAPRAARLLRHPRGRVSARLPGAGQGVVRARDRGMRCGMLSTARGVAPVANRHGIMPHIAMLALPRADRLNVLCTLI